MPLCELAIARTAANWLRSVEYVHAARGVARFPEGAGMNPELRRKTDDLTTRLTHLRDSL